MIVASVIAVPAAVINPVADSAAKPTAATNRVRKGVSIIGIASVLTAVAGKPA